MNKELLLSGLQKRFRYPIQNMGRFELIGFSNLIKRFGTTDFRRLPGDPLYEEIIKTGLILGYNERRTYNGEFYGFHWGIDIVSSNGTPVFAADEGVVADVFSIDDLTENFKGEAYGNCIVVENAYDCQKVFTLYGHLAFLGNKYVKGNNIVQGERIGTIGKGFTNENGGWPPHLHFQVSLSGEGLFAYGGQELEQETINPKKIFGLK
ncbi:peptidoglycan DD-metalloendopeptidase family protein [Candidatus Woesearchaeota archaeon]|nr:peptidoglycan DD-metalloendopeptidase family protein [Candidatus Woesearchaeota archaeon]